MLRARCLSSLRAFAVVLPWLRGKCFTLTRLGGELKPHIDGPVKVRCSVSNPRKSWHVASSYFYLNMDRTLLLGGIEMPFRALIGLAGAAAGIQRVSRWTQAEAGRGRGVAARRGEARRGLTEATAGRTDIAPPAPK